MGIQKYLHMHSDKNGFVPCKLIVYTIVKLCMVYDGACIDNHSSGYLGLADQLYAAQGTNSAHVGYS